MDDLASYVQTMSNKWWTYDVFLSFRGEDTRRNFTDHLYHALTDAGLYTFRDDNELSRGEGISSELLKAIHKSRICIIVFSKNYANSKWCLEELAEIVDCRRNSSQLLLPVFYDVDPSDVGKQLNSFGEAFAKHEQEFTPERSKVDRWRVALKEASRISGWDLKNFADGHESKFIREIVGHILNKLRRPNLNVATYPIGMEARVKQLSLSMSVDDATRILGICGMGGSGKTTLSKALFNEYFNSFDGHSFLANIRENSNSSNGLTQLQMQLLSDVLKKKEMTEIRNVDEGVNIIKERLCRKKVFLVLDDVDSMDQLNALTRERDWFGLGSLIILTTRDKHLLELLKVDEVYMTEDNLLNKEESLMLFSWHAFQAPKPPNEFIEYSKNVVSYCRSLPLALEVLGSFLCRRNNIEWESVMEKLKRIPHKDVNKKLKLSYDALNDDTEKKIFLDVSCFFLTMEKSLVVKILDGCGFFGEAGLSVLISRCLVKVDDKGCLMMHDLLRDMGREIVREESLNEPGKRTRLWLQEEIEEVFENNTGSENIEGLALQFSNEKFKTTTFRNMRNLRLLNLNSINFIGSFHHLTSKKLRWIYWKEFPFKVISNDLYLERIVVIDMRFSKLEEFWKGRQCLGCLKILDLSNSNKLAQISNFSKLPNLEDLRLGYCRNLSELDQSIGQLRRLHSVDLRYCESLESLPNEICKLKSLQFLSIDGCSKINKLPEELGELKSLKTILMDHTKIREIPQFIVQCEKLENLSSTWCYDRKVLMQRKDYDPLSFLPPSLQGLRFLKVMNLKGCSLTDNDIPMDFESLSSLEELTLGYNDFRHFPAILRGLFKLVYLSFRTCQKLESIPELPKNLKDFSAANCYLLKRTPDLSKLEQPLERLDLGSCKTLIEVVGLLVRLGGKVNLSRCSNLSSTFKMDLVKKWIEVDDGALVLPKGDLNLLDFFNFDSGPSLSFQVLQGHPRILGLQFCVVFGNDYEYVEDMILRIKSTSKRKGHSWYFNFNIGFIPTCGFFESACLVKFDDCSALQLDVGDYVEVVPQWKANTIEGLSCRIVYGKYEGENVDSNLIE